MKVNHNAKQKYEIHCIYLIVSLSWHLVRGRRRIVRVELTGEAWRTRRMYGEHWQCCGEPDPLSGHSSLLEYLSTTIKETRIEPVGKPYREVCLRSELWPWMAHQPNSWSKHPGTRIEQVLAYCRDEQKYVGCIELLFCLTVTMTFGVQTWNFIGLMDEIVPIYPPSFTEIRSKIREK